MTPRGTCTVPPKGWECSREAGHDGPCAATYAPGKLARLRWQLTYLVNWLRPNERLADRLMPWVAANATVWPSTHAVHGHLVAQIKDRQEALLLARRAIHDLCLERSSTDGYKSVFAAINEALDA